MKDTLFKTTAAAAVFVLLAASLAVFLVHVANDAERGKSRAAEKIEWGVYEKGSESGYLASGKCVFLLVSLRPYVYRELEASDLKRLSGNREYVALMCEYARWDDPRVRHIHRTVGFIKDPFLVFYSPDGETVAFDPVSFEELAFRNNRGQNDQESEFITH